MNLTSPRVSVVIPCRDERHHIERCLRSILSQAEPTGGMELVIADAISEDGTREVIQQFAAHDPRVRMIDNPHKITPIGLNAAIRAARGEIIIRMDAHSEYARDYVVRCVETLGVTGADNVGGPPQVKSRSYVQRAVGAAFHSPFSTGGAGFHRPHFEGEVDTIHFGCWKKAKLLEVGLFDEELVRNQDDELNYRIKMSGGRLWQSSDIRSWYWPRTSLGGLFKQYFQYGYWKARVMQKHARLASVRHVVPVLFAMGLATGWLAGFVHPALWFAYVTAIAAYTIVSVGFSLRTAALAGWNLLPILPVVFFVYHLSYGVGLAAGLVDFFVLRPSGRPWLRPAASS